MKYYVVLILVLLASACSEDDTKKQVTYDSIFGVWKYSDPDGKFSTKFEVYKKDADDYDIRNITLIVDGDNRDVEASPDYVTEDQSEDFLGQITIPANGISISFYENAANGSFTELACGFLVFYTESQEENFSNVKLTR